ncbi:desi2 [Symbiodinium sp. CCMP2592]|nr:desi2 [Symbiodinium sp. CCMP2592]
MTRRHEIVQMVTYLDKAQRIFGDEPHLHVAFDGSSVGGKPLEAYKFYSPRTTHISVRLGRFWQDYDWSTLQRAFGGIKQAWYTTQQVVPDAVLPEKEPKCHQLLRDNMLWCSKVSGRLEDPCLYGNILDLYPEFKDQGAFEEKKALLYNCTINSSCPCRTHGSPTGARAVMSCCVPKSHFDVSGLPCPDFSAAGKRRRMEGPTNSVFLAHGRLHGTLQTPLLLIENVQGLDVQMLLKTHTQYELYQIFTEPKELGFAATSRARTYIIAAHKSKCVCLHDPFELHDAIKRRMAEYASTTVADYLVATEQDILLEAQETGRVRNIEHRPGVQNYSYYLTARELESLRILDCKYREQFRREPGTDGNLVYHLGDNASWNTSWSAVSGALPTFRLGASSSKYWLPRYRRWLTSREKLVAMGFPVTAETAEALGTPTVFATDVKRAADILGNCMHFTTAGIMQLIALSCFGTDKRTQTQRLKNEYLRLNQPMAECSLVDLVRRVEIEFSKSKHFEVQKGGRGWLVLCGDQFRRLPEPKSGSWEVETDPATGVPFLDDKDHSRMWAISPFQSKARVLFANVKYSTA